MNYRVKFVEDAQMPSGQLWVMCQHDDETVLCLSTLVRYLDDVLYARVLEQAWGGYRGLRGNTLPRQRISQSV